MESIMKKVLFVLICSVFLLSVTAIRAEGGHADRVIEEAREALQKIAPDLEQSTEEFFDGTQYVLPEMLKPTAADYAGAFKVVRKNGYFVGAYRANGDFSFLQSTDGEYWLIPLSYGKEEPSGSIQFVEEKSFDASTR